VVNSTGTVVNHLAYDSFGNITAESNPGLAFRFTYTGRELDEATGLYYYRARYYAPDTGRFIGEDPSRFDGGDANLYRYVGNNALVLVDPRGLCAEDGGLLKYITPDFYGTEFSGGFGLGPKGANGHLDIISGGVIYDATKGEWVATSALGLHLGGDIGAPSGPGAGGDIGVDMKELSITYSSEGTTYKSLYGISGSAKGKGGYSYVIGMLGIGGGGGGKAMVGTEMTVKKGADLNVVQKVLLGYSADNPTLQAVLSATSSDIDFSFTGETEVYTVETVSADAGGYAKVGGSVSVVAGKKQVHHSLDKNWTIKWPWQD
jgi:RHS repeat-associated protein